MFLTGAEYIEVQNIAWMFDVPLHDALELYLKTVERVEVPQV